MPSSQDIYDYERERVHKKWSKEVPGISFLGAQKMEQEQHEAGLGERLYKKRKEEDRLIEVYLKSKE